MHQYMATGMEMEASFDSITMEAGFHFYEVTNDSDDDVPSYGFFYERELMRYMAWYAPWPDAR